MTDINAVINVLADKKADLALLKAQFEADNAALITDIEDLENEVKAYVLAEPQTIKTEKMVVTWSKGRETWDAKILTGYAVAHPEILAAKKVGQPVVSFKLLKK